MSFKSRCKSEKGAAAVEFALVVPLLLVLVFGIIEFSRIYNAQISVTNAAREGARYMVVHSGTTLISDTQNVVIAAAPSVTPAVTRTQISISPTTCTSGTDVAVTVTYPMTLLTGFFDPSITLKGKAVMRCGG